ncbi:unnamed protein product [Gongylonema pulchrum]|uniref:Uncharacterized protein n=1 Tax=Gongylonema pulchrum TaxID=637853 RepID=A0A183DL64_9BILA|nr:unnamed protein product [Gongylonema pulchrum]
MAIKPVEEEVLDDEEMEEDEDEETEDDEEIQQSPSEIMLAMMKIFQLQKNTSESTNIFMPHDESK